MNDTLHPHLLATNFVGLLFVAGFLAVAVFGLPATFIVVGFLKLSVAFRTISSCQAVSFVETGLAAFSAHSLILSRQLMIGCAGLLITFLPRAYGLLSE
jgi:hypothetical protein